MLSEVLLFNLISSNLFSSSTCASIILVARSRWLNHKQGIATLTFILHLIKSANYKGSTIRAILTINCAHLCSHCKSISQDLTWDANTKHLLILSGFLSTSEHETFTIRYQSIYNLFHYISFLLIILHIQFECLYCRFFYRYLEPSSCL